MNKINSFYLNSLRNLEHYQFMSDFNSLVTKYTPVELGVDDLFPDFVNALTNESVAIRVEQGSIKSKLIEEYDIHRDNTLNGIGLSARASMLSPFADEVESATIIKHLLDQYGDIRNLSYNEESAALSNLIVDLKKAEYVIHIDKIGRTSWVTELEKQNNQFISLVEERTTEFSGRESGNVRSTRKQIDPFYNQIIEQINASVVLKTIKTKVPEFIKELNEKIKYYKTTIATRQGRNKEEKIVAGN